MESNTSSPFRLEKLSRRERDILILLGQGMTDPEIAERLVISLHTVKWYDRQIYNKLGAANRAEAVIRARELGWLPHETSFQKAAHHLPHMITSFIGRDKEIGQLIRMVRKFSLITLTGAGGVGKTRLALKVAEDLQDEFRHGVWWVDLAPLTDPNRLTEAIASVFQLKAHGETPLQEVLINYLRNKDLLLVLDNCEHLLEAVAQQAYAALREAPHLKMLATSRAPLRVSGEMAFRVPSMTVPQAPPPPGAGDLLQFEAVQLFVERAQATQTGFRLSPHHVTPLVQICQRLDGIPLAIELAAARVRMLSVAQIADRLEQSFQILTGGSQTALPRHQTLQASIDWSIGFLSPQERTLLYRLSIFAGGCTLEAAERVCADEEGDEADRIQTHQVVDLLGGLIDQSLVQFEIQSEAAPRYYLLETVRQVACEKLAARGEEAALRERHLDYCLWLGQQAEPHLRAFQAKSWLDRLEGELDNLRAALTWALSHSLMKGLQLATALWWFWQTYRRLEAEDWLEALLNRAREQLDYAALDIDAKAALGRAINVLKYFIQTDFSLSLDRKEQLEKAAYLDSREIFRELGDAYQLEFAIACYYSEKSIKNGFAGRERFYALNARFWLAESDVDLALLLPHDHEKTLPYAQENLDIRLEIGDLEGQALALVVLGFIEWEQGNIDRCVELTEKAMDYYEAIGDRWNLGFKHSGFALFETIYDHYQAATRHTDALEAIAQELNDPWLLFRVPVCRASIAMKTGAYDQAIQYCQTALAGIQNLPVDQRAEIFFYLVYSHLAQGNREQALDYLLQYFTPESLVDHLDWHYYTVQYLGLFAAKTRQWDRAVTCLGFLEQMFTHRPWFIHHFSTADLERNDQALATARAALGEEVYQAAWEAGRAMTVEQIVHLTQDMLS